MSDFPYTDAQVRAYAKALNLPRNGARTDILNLREAGVTLGFPASGDFPYTDEQVDVVAGALGIHPKAARKELMHLALAGITATIPPVRFLAVRVDEELSEVYDRSQEIQPVASFLGVRARQYAREHAARLNREAGA